MKGYLKLTVLLAFMLAAATGCKEENEPEGTDFSLKMNFKYGSQNLVYGQEYDYGTDSKIKIELVRFYVSLPELQTADGNWVPFPNAYFIFQPDNAVFQAGKMPEGNYTALRFGLGVDNSRNVETDPDAIPATDYPLDSPLNAANDMYWTWATGYIFVKVEGRIDANGNGSYADLDDKIISYHPGVAELYRTVSLSKNINIGNEATQAELTLDVAKLFENVDLLQYPFAHPLNADHPEFATARRMMDSFVTAFE